MRYSTKAQRWQATCPKTAKTRSEETRMDALALLKADHDKAKKLMSELEDDAPRPPIHTRRLLLSMGRTFVSGGGV